MKGIYWCQVSIKSVYHREKTQSIRYSPHPFPSGISDGDFDKNIAIVLQKYPVLLLSLTIFLML